MSNRVEDDLAKGVKVAPSSLEEMISHFDGWDPLLVAPFQQFRTMTDTGDYDKPERDNIMLGYLIEVETASL